MVTPAGPEPAASRLKISGKHFPSSYWSIHQNYRVLQSICDNSGDMDVSKYYNALFVKFFFKNWRMGWDSNPRRAFTLAGFQDQCLQPLGHSSNRGAGVHQALETFNYLRYYRPRLWWSGGRAAEGGGLLSHCTGRPVPGVRIPPTPPFANSVNSPVKSMVQNL